MAPVLARHEVAEPLVRQLVCYETVAAEEVLRLRREQRAVVQRGEAGVLHAAPVVVVDGGLAVFRPRVVHANLALEELHHVLRLAERVRRGGEVAECGPELQRDVAVLVLDFLQLPGDQRDEVVHVWLLLHPMKRREPARAGLRGDLPTIRERDHASRHAAGHLAGELLDRMVERRKPMPRLARLALRPQMRLGVTHLRRAEVEAFARLGGILHRHARLLPDRNRGREGEDKLAVGDLMGGQLLRAGHRRDTQLDGVQPQLFERGGDGLEGERGGAGDGAGLEVRRHVEREVEDVHAAVGGVFAVGGRIHGGRGELRGAPAAEMGLLGGKRGGDCGQSEREQREEGGGADLHGGESK